MDYNLKPLHRVLIEIYQEMDKICQRHGLRLFGTSGTALGAVRHHGFIPWDDDLDVGMPRPDYEKFMEIADAELPAWLHTLTWKNCSDYTYLFGKVIITDPARVEAICAETHMPAPMGIFIDVFPFDGYPTSWLGRKLRIARRALYKAKGFALANTWSSLPNLEARIGWLMMKCFGFLCPARTYQDTLKLHETEMMRIPYETAERVINNVWFQEEVRFSKSPRNEWYSAQNIGRGRLLPFEGETMRVFDDVDIYLRSVYRDYMKLPPVDKQKPAHGLETMEDFPWRFGPAVK